MSILHVVSVSGGKDSAATTILALETEPRESLRFVMADTGNEHESTYEYLGYMERHLGIQIVRLKASFAREMAGKREYILKHWPGKGVAPEAVARAAAAMTPTGNPFLDLCLWKGRFPSRTAQFCTQFLKTEPLVEYQMALIETGQCEAVWSWQGIRIDESRRRVSVKLGDITRTAQYAEDQGSVVVPANGDSILFTPVISCCTCGMPHSA